MFRRCKRATPSSVGCGAALILAGAVEVALGQFSGLVLFGDSLTDVGNVHHQTFGISPQSPPYFNGRYSNGPLWAETFADELGLPALVPSRRGGRDYAFGGTKTGSGSSVFFPFFFPNIGSQINNYLGAGNSPQPSELFVIWGGGNDFIDGQTNPQIPVTNISNHVTTLANAGARQFLVPNLPPLGQVPRFVGTPDEPIFDARSIQFNDLLETTLNNLEISLDIDIWQLDIEGLFHQMLTNPSAYGFTNVTGTALVGNTPVPNPDEYVFWDEIHPTRVAHAILGTTAAELISTHEWVSTQTGGDWTTAGNWDPAGVPAPDWIAHLVNDNIAQQQAVAVGANSTVRRILVRGETGAMTLIVQSVARLEATERFDVEQDGRLSLQGGTLATPLLMIGGGGRVGGTGMIESDSVVNAGGVIAPGEPGSVLRIDGNFTQQAQGTIAIELGGTAPGLHDLLEISGDATLGGALAVHLTDGFVALPGDTFLSMTFGSRSGDVSIVNETGFAGLRFDKLYTDTSLTVRADATGGDANLDGIVNLSDFNTLAANFGQIGVSWLMGDFTGDGVVNLGDFNVLAANFGFSASSAGPSPDEWANLASRIPEPSGVSTAILLTMALRRRRGGRTLTPVNPEHVTTGFSVSSFTESRRNPRNYTGF